MAYPTPINIQLPKSELPHDLFMKTKPQWLSFQFLAQITPPLHAGQSPPPSPSTPAYLASNRSSLPKSKPPPMLIPTSQPFNSSLPHLK
ncbi:hypothetical protein PILCRDRAFT_3756 [Piloderma croceum F 1598]|uniref:Uncharacterized protein n=1 Tax=Piloderma croceum (strain F 1598) TaxID=765440 RepID=A0A0C3GBP3_PILCF|nr:hypothetical protein PILCRDRAFT_3756 [Piloderma croceum F 1598]